MIDVSECFNMIGEDGCMDVASSLGMQGIDPSIGTISIPIFEPICMKILIGQDCGFICDSIAEFNAIKQLNRTCGSVAITLNLFDMDILTLLGALLVFTPNTGMNCFIKLSIIDLANITGDILGMLAKASGIPIPDAIIDSDIEQQRVKGEIIDKIFSMAIDALQKDMENKGIALREWEELYDYYVILRESGEMQEMAEYRNMMNAFIM